MKYEKVVDSIYSEINNEYESIRKTAEKYNRKDSTFDFSESFAESRKYAERNPAFAYLTIKLNQLAELWDATLVESRLNNSKDKDIVMPRHRFLFVHNARYEMNKPKASLYCKNLPPDKRLICIQVTRKKPYNLLCILHEMGHFIGWRKRDTRLDTYMIPMIAEAICLQLYEYACRELTDVSSDYDARIGCILHLEPHYANHIRSESSKILMALRKIQSTIKEELRKCYNISKKIYIEECNKNGELEIEEAKGVKSAFFSCIQALLLDTIYNMLTDKCFIEKCIIQATFDETDVDKGKLQNCLRKAFVKLEHDIESGKPLWYDEFEKRLEEPAADVFMIKMSGINIRQYIDLITVQLQELFIDKEYSEDRLYTTLALPVNTVRVISICLSFNAQEKDFLYSTDWIFKKCGFRTKTLERICLREQLYAMYKVAIELRKNADENDFFDPTHFVVDYVNELLIDPRYNKEDKYPYLEKMRQITKQTMSIWNSWFGSIIAYFKIVFLKDI